MRKILRSSLKTAVAVIAFSPFLAAVAFAQTTPDVRGGGGGRPADPGVRGGTPGAGCFLDALGTTEQQFFLAAGRRFAEIDSVSGNAGDAAANPGLPAGGTTGTLTLCPNTTPVTTPLLNGSGLGTGFNMNTCAGCHAQPAVGGSSPGLNPQVRVANLDGATNTVPSF